jgi:hypothetical protein
MGYLPSFSEPTTAHPLPNSKPEDLFIRVVLFMPNSFHAIERVLGLAYGVILCPD